MFSSLLRSARLTRILAFEEDGIVIDERVKSTEGCLRSLGISNWRVARSLVDPHRMRYGVRGCFSAITICCDAWACGPSGVCTPLMLVDLAEHALPLMISESDALRSHAGQYMPVWLDMVPQLHVIIVKAG